jgi:predicted RNA-binding Zn-ribbon protein involved in translation (DUF1610 family)
MKKAICIAVMLVVCLAHATLVSAFPCSLPEFNLIPKDTGISLSPTMYSLLTSTDPSINPALVNAVVGARNAWKMTNAAGRLGDWTGAVPDSHDPECPAGQPPFRLSAFDFTDTSTTCETIQTYARTHLIDPATTVAFVDYFSNDAFLNTCPACGTKSITFNTHFMFSIGPNPMPGYYDVWSVLAHEFGHMLGFAHMVGTTCSDPLGIPAPHCSQDQDRTTMGSPVFTGETCERDLNDSDKSNANALYPAPPILKADVVVYRPGAGAWLIRRSFDGGLTQVNWGCSACGDKPVAADYDGDGFSDVAVYRTTTAEWWIQRSSDGGTSYFVFGCPSCGDIPVPGDYDGDHRADIAVFRPNTGEWFIYRSSDSGVTQVGWGCGACGDIAVPADYDGDGRADIAVYRSSTGEWCILRSSDGGLTYLGWGCPACGDTAVPADYDGDHRADVAVYRSSTGEWFIRRSSDGGLTQVGFGCAACGDVSVLSDYDGDGRSDVAVYRPGTAEWFMLQSSLGYRSIVWNAAGQQDQPVKFLKR